MEQLLGKRRKRSTQILTVARLDAWILVREANGGAGIEPPEHVAALGREFPSVVDGLPAAAHAAARTRHDLDEVIVHQSVADRIEELRHLGEPMGHGDAHRRAGDIGHGLLPALLSAYGMEEIRVGILARHQIVSRAHGGLHDAARRAEDHARARTETERCVERVLGQCGDVHVARADHAHHLAHGEGYIDVADAVRVAHARQRALGLLGRARHDRDHKEALGLHAQDLRIIALGDGAEHLLRRLGRRQTVGELGVAGLDKAHPARAARREHGPVAGGVVDVGAIGGRVDLVGGRGAVIGRRCPARGIPRHALRPQAFEQLGALLHDGEVGREIGVEHILESHTAQRAGQTLDRRVLARKPQLLAPGRAHGGRHLDEHDLLGVGDGIEHGLGIVALAERPRGAMRDALAAGDAIGLGDGLAALGTNGRVRGTVGEVPDAEPLYLFADLDAAHAFDALVVIADDGESQVPALVRKMLSIRQVIDAQVVRERLEAAVAAAHAARALRVVLREQELHVGAACLTGLGAVGAHDHAVEHVVVARRHELVAALDLDHAHAAAAELVEVAQVAERGDLDAHGLGRIEDRGVRGNAGLAVVDDQMDHGRIRVRGGRGFSSDQVLGGR